MSLQLHGPYGLAALRARIAERYWCGNEEALEVALLYVFADFAPGGTGDQVPWAWLEAIDPVAIHDLSQEDRLAIQSAYSVGIQHLSEILLQQGVRLRPR